MGEDQAFLSPNVRHISGRSRACPCGSPALPSLQEDGGAMIMTNGYFILWLCSTNGSLQEPARDSEIGWGLPNQKQACK